MLLSNTPLRAIVNPFSAPLAADGRACALVQTDPEHPSAEEYVGVRIAVGLKPRRGNPYGDKTFVRVARYDLQERRLDDTSYHRGKVRSGELFAADLETARRCGVAELQANALPSAASAAAAALPDVDLAKVWEEQGLGAFVPIATKAQGKARMSREVLSTLTAQGQEGAIEVTESASAQKEEGDV